MADEDQSRTSQLEEAHRTLNRLVEKNAKRFGAAKLRPITFEDACQHIKQLLAKSKRKLAELDSNN